MKRSEYEALIRDRIRSLESIEEDGSREKALEAMSARQEIRKLEGWLEESQVRSLGLEPGSREAAERQLTARLKARKEGGL